MKDTKKVKFLSCGFCGSIGGHKVRNKATGLVVPITLKKLKTGGYACQMCIMRMLMSEEG